MASKYCWLPVYAVHLDAREDWTQVTILTMYPENVGYVIEEHYCVRQAYLRCYGGQFFMQVVREVDVDTRNSSEMYMSRIFLETFDGKVWSYTHRYVPSEDLKTARQIIDNYQKQVQGLRIRIVEKYEDYSIVDVLGGNKEIREESVNSPVVLVGVSNRVEEDSQEEQELTRAEPRYRYYFLNVSKFEADGNFRWKLQEEVRSRCSWLRDVTRRADKEGRQVSQSVLNKKGFVTKLPARIRPDEWVVIEAEIILTAAFDEAFEDTLSRFWQDQLFRGFV